MSQKMKYGYWGMRGNGQIGRLLLAYTGSNWEDVKYTSPPDWFGKDKKGLQIPFANLPYLIDGDFKLAEAKAVNFYIISKSGKVELLGKNLQDQCRVQSLVSVLIDVKSLVQSLIFNPDWKSKVAEVTGKLTPKLDQLTKFYGDKEFSLGYLTLVDFYVSEYSYHIEQVLPELFSKYTVLKKVRMCFQNLPEIKKYYSQDTAMKGPFFSAPAAVQF